MRDFLFLGYNDNKKVDTDAFADYLISKGLKFCKSDVSTSLYSKNINYQIEIDNNQAIECNGTYLFNGDIYGILGTHNPSLLSPSEVYALLSNQQLHNNFVPVEGSACILGAFDNKIILQSDVEGYRKLFYYKTPDILCVSTRLKFILNAVKEDWSIRKNAAISYINGRESKWPLTFINGIYVMPPLSRAEVTQSGITITSKTLSNFYELKKISKQDLKERLYSQYKLISDRKTTQNTAVTLSAGIDSSCLTKLYSREHLGKFTAISVGYVSNRERDNNIYNETVYAEKIAKDLNIPFKSYVFNREEFFQEFDSFLDIIDQPAHDASSNNIMNRFLKQDNFDMVVNGMGGDANFSFKKSRLYSYKLFKLSQIIGFNSMSKLGSLFNYKGPLELFRIYDKDITVATYHDAIENKSLYVSSLGKYISNKKLQELYDEHLLRSDFYNTIFENSKTALELFYSYSVFGNPDENHSLIAAERNNMQILMPFVNIPAVLMQLNGSHFNDVNNRRFEMEIFGGINTNLLAKVKSGFSIPYSEWIPPVANEVFEYFLDLKYFKTSELNLQEYWSHYKKDDSFRNSVDVNKNIWKLLIFKKFTEANNIKLI